MENLTTADILGEENEEVRYDACGYFYGCHNVSRVCRG